jgi:hypothetical protein
MNINIDEAELIKFGKACAGIGLIIVYILTLVGCVIGLAVLLVHFFWVVAPIIILIIIGIAAWTNKEPLSEGFDDFAEAFQIWIKILKEKINEFKNKKT